jgi:hypothetical protein
MLNFKKLLCKVFGHSLSKIPIHHFKNFGSLQERLNKEKVVFGYIGKGFKDIRKKTLIYCNRCKCWEIK